MLSHQFLVNGPYSKGAWVPPADLARKIINAAEEHDQAYLIALDEPDIILYANDDDEGYRLTLGVAHDGDQPEIPTWAEWLDRQGIDPNDVDAVAEHAIDYGLYDPESGETFVPPAPESNIPDKLFEHYLVWDWVMRDSASAQAFHYLADLNLGPQQPNERLETLGELHLIDGVSPGNDSRIVSADSLEALSCLQHRVLDLKIAAAVRFA